MSLELFLFGFPRCQQKGQPIQLHRRKSLALLAYLALNRQPHGRDALSTLFYPDSANALAYLRRDLSEIRQYLGDVLLTEQTISLAHDKLWVDVAEFQKSVEKGDNNNLPISQSRGVLTANLQKAVALYTADFLAGFTLPDSPAFDEWQFFQAEKLRRDLANVLAQLVHAYTSQNQLAEATAVAQRWVALDPLHEPAQRQLIELYARSSQRAEAHRQYQALTRQLADELGVAPQAETQQLYERIRHQTADSSLIGGRFRLIKSAESLLGHGGVGDVYRGEDTQTGQPVAIKIPRPEVIAQHPLLLARFTREGETLRRLNHPNIVQMVTAVSENNQHYLIMEYVSGGSLQTLLAQQAPLPLARILAIALGLADALARAHHLNIIHRDLKPANVLLAEDGTPRLSDFGLAHLDSVPPLTQSGMLLGTISYLSPEACQGEAVDGRADIWALGLLLYEMLTGEHPFRADTIPATLTAILNRPLPSLPQSHLPAPMADLIGRMLVKNPAERLPSMRLVGAELEAIQHGRPLTAITPKPAPRLPTFLHEETGEIAERSHFVARQAEMARLQENLGEAMAGNGRVLFITGGAGRGKTSLLAEFARRAQASHPDLIVAGGVCNAYAGVGDPYLPFRELMGLLTGDVEARLAAKAMSRNQARRLWQLTPLTVQLLLEHSPSLLDVFVSGKALLARVQTAVPDTAVLTQLQERISHPLTGLQQSGLFSEFTELLQQLARHHPLLLTLDDLHWADEASLGLLFHLGRRLAGSPILIIGTYRPDELVYGREGTHHPLEKVLDELQRTFGDMVINLAAVDQGNGRAFVDALLDSEPNRLGEPFRQPLFQQTGGHPLFTVELLREMQARGSLVQDEAGYWHEAGEVNWQTMPTRTEAVIAQRLGRLDNSWQDILRVASVEGELFTLEVVAQVKGLNRRELAEGFGRELVKQHRLLAAQGMERLETSGQPLSRYRFQHHLFQAYLYHSLDEIERVYQHEAVGNALETLYGDQVDEIASQCARHFQEAGLTLKAIEYLRRAGERAIRLSTYDEAIDSLQRGLTLLNDQPISPENARQELNLRLALGEATRKAGQFTESLPMFKQAAAIAREQGWPSELARAALGYEDSLWRFNLPAELATLLLEEAFNALGEKEAVLKARVWVNLARTRMGVSSPEQFATIAQQALEMARQVNDPLALYDALYLIIRSDRRPEKSAERLVMLTEVLQLAQTMGDQERIDNSYGFRIQEFLELGDMVSFQLEDDIITLGAQKLRQPFYNYYPSLSRVTLAVFAGRFAEAEQIAQHTLEIGRQMGVENVDGVYGVQMFSIRREQGQLRELAPLVRLFVTQNPASAAWRPGLALIYSELALRAEAQQEFETLATNDFATLPQDALWPTTITYLAEVCAYLGDVKRAAILYQFLLPYDGRAIVVGLHTFCYGAAARFLGILATTMSRWAEAEHHFEDALAMNSRMGARPWLAHTQHQYALMLRAQGKAADQKKAKALLDEALKTAEELGMKGLVEKIDALGFGEGNNMRRKT
jgi:predicted ATPase/DNA-binding SARP family transcriptional activator